VHLVVFIAYILIVSVTDCCIHCIHIFSASAASVIIKFSVQCSVSVFSSYLSECTEHTLRTASVCVIISWEGHSDLDSITHGLQQIRHNGVVPEICEPTVRLTRVHWTWQKETRSCHANITTYQDKHHYLSEKHNNLSGNGLSFTTECLADSNVALNQSILCTIHCWSYDMTDISLVSVLLTQA